jgi:CelD/BcsL family acetyltransferase involved in cellulose biosynthesis
VAVEEINDAERLLAYADQWNSLLVDTVGASYFSSYDWFAVYWKHFAGRQRLRVLVARDRGRILGLVPLAVARERTKVGWLRSLRYPLHGWGSFYGPIGGDRQPLLTAAFRHLSITARDWELLEMLWVDQDGADQNATAGALSDAGLAYRRSPWLASAQIDVTGGWEAYWKSRTSHFRTNVRSAERRLQQAGDISYVRYRPRGAAAGESDPRWDLYDHCVRLAAKSWQGASTSGTTLSHESIRTYLREAHERAAAFGGVDVNLLLVGGQPVAFAYNYHYAGYVYGLRAGFDPSFAGAGNVLLRRMVEDSCHRGDQTIDLGPGSLQAKRHWQTHLATAWRYTHYGTASPRAQLLRALHSAKDMVGRHSETAPVGR